MEDKQPSIRDMAGRFTPGHPGLKKKGIPEYQRQTRELMWQFFEAKAKDLPEIYEQLSPTGKSKLILSVAEYFLPKQRELLIDATVEKSGATVDYAKLSDSALREILNATTIDNE